MDTQRLIAFVVFSFSLLMLWNAWQEYTHPKQAVVAGAPAAVKGQAAAPDALPAPGQALKGVPQPVESAGVAKGARAKGRKRLAV